MCPINGRPSKGVVDLDEVFRTLSHPVRRRILVAIKEDNPRDREEFETVEYRPAGATDETSSVELHHVHLPRLDAADFIDWNRRTGEVTRGEHFEDIRPLLELMDDHRDELPDDWP